MSGTTLFLPSICLLAFLKSMSLQDTITSKPATYMLKMGSYPNPGLVTNSMNASLMQAF